MENNDLVFLRLKEYLSDKYSVESTNINEDTSLLNDLDFKGDDIDDFFSSLIRDFNVKVNELNLSRYYVGDEPFDFLSPIGRFLKGKKKTSKPTIKISDIVHFIKTGTLR